MMSVQDIRARFPDEQRKLWEIDRILVQEPRPGADGDRWAIDLRAKYSNANMRMGAGSSQLGRKVPVVKALVAMDAYLEGVEIERLDLWGAQLNNEALVAVLGTRWLASVRDLNLGSNRISSKGISALAKHPVAKQLQELRLSYNKLGNALAKVNFPDLERLELVYCGITDKALPGLGTAKLPKLTALVLDAAALHTTTEKLVNAGRRGDRLAEPVFTAAALEAFAKTPLAGQLEILSLGSLEIGEDQAKVIGDHFESLKALELHEAKMSAASLTALSSGRGLGSLRKLDLFRTFAPNYSSRAERIAPTQETARALACVGASRFASTLESLVLGHIAVGPIGVRALLECGRLERLRSLDLRNCQLGNEGLQALADCGGSIDTLVLGGNEIGVAGVEALFDSPLGRQLVAVDLQYNQLRDEGGAVLARADAPALARVGLSGAHLTDLSAKAIASSPLASRLITLILLDNRISDAGAAALAEAKMPKLERLHLGKNCLTDQGVQALRSAHGQIQLHLDEQDPSKLPPTILGNPRMRFVEVQGITKFTPAPVPPSLRERFPHPAWLARDLCNPAWAYAMPKTDQGYEVSVVEVDTERVVVPNPAIRTPLPTCSVSEDSRWLGVKAFRDAAYVVALDDGQTTRLGDVLTHQEGGSGFCDGRLVVLDCDTEGDWEGRLDVYAQTEGTWRLEHRVGGFFGVRDNLVILADERMFAVTGRGGLFFCAVRGDQFRYLGRLPVERYGVFGVDGRVFVHIDNRYTYELVDIDEVLDAAFASGESPSSLDLAADDWAY